MLMVMLAGNLIGWPVAYDAFSRGISGMTFVNAMGAHLLAAAVITGVAGRPGLEHG